MIDIQQPPAEYLPYDGPVIELRLPMQRVKTICYVLGVRGIEVKGCGTFAPGGCLIVYPIEDDGAIREHELAHCNGWRH